MLQAVSAVTHYPTTQIEIATDGCGIPTFAMPLAYIAWGFARLCVPSLFDVERASAVERVMAAMTHHPDMVTEEHSFNTYLIEGFARRVLAKEGAKGLYCLCDRERKIGVALKIEDGDKEAIPPIIHELLRQLSLGTDKELEPIARYDHQDISNTCGDVVGYMNPVFSLVPQTTQL